MSIVEDDIVREIVISVIIDDIKGFGEIDDRTLSYITRRVDKIITLTKLYVDVMIEIL